MVGYALGVKFYVRNLDRPNLERLFHQIGAELASVEDAQVGLLDNAVSIDLGAGSLEIDVTTEADTPEQAETIAKAAILYALEETGGSPANEDEFKGFIESSGASAAAEKFAEFGLEVTSREPVSL